MITLASVRPTGHALQILLGGHAVHDQAHCGRHHVVLVAALGEDKGHGVLEKVAPHGGLAPLVASLHRRMHCSLEVRSQRGRGAQHLRELEAVVTCSTLSVRLGGSEHVPKLRALKAPCRQRSLGPFPQRALQAAWAGALRARAARSRRKRREPTVPQRPQARRRDAGPWLARPHSLAALPAQQPAGRATPLLVRLLRAARAAALVGDGRSPETDLKHGYAILAFGRQQALGPSLLARCRSIMSSAYPAFPRLW